MKVSLPQNPWSERKGLVLDLPEDWEVRVGEIAGAGSPAIGTEEVRAALKNPSGTPPLRELARGRGEVVIVFDDLSRITPVSLVIPAILEELDLAGIKPERIRLVAALGCHGAMSRGDFVKKLGEDVVRTFPVYNHNPFYGCTYVGTTRRGTRLSVNGEVMACDLKIAIGSVVPHIMTGFGGGGKIVLPGISSFESVEEFHRRGQEFLRRKGRCSVLELLEDNPLREDMEDAARLVGLDFKVELLVNAKGEAIAIFAGSPEVAYRRALRKARDHYRVPSISGVDVVIANVFSKANEGEIGVLTTMDLLKESGGEIVLVIQIPEGHVTHYLMGTFGRKAQSPMPLKVPLPEKVRKLLVLTSYPEEALRDYFTPPQKVTFISSWGEALDFLRPRSPKRVAVFPSADIHYLS